MAYFYPATGGIEKHVYELAKRLVNSYNFEIVVVTSNHLENKYKEEIISGIKVYRLPILFKISNTPINPMWYFYLKKIIKKENPLLINGRAPVPGLADLGAICRGKIPFVLGYHFPSMKKGKSLFDILIFIYENTILKYILNKSTVIICSSDYIRKNLFSQYINKSITITQGIDSKLFKPTKLKAENSILFVGNYATHIKGLQELIISFSNVTKKINDIKLVVVGEGNNKEYFELIKKLKLENKVIFKGKLSGKPLVKEYQKATIVVVPSIIDNFPSVILEAMSCGKAVVATNVGGIPDILDSNVGILVEPNNEHQLTDAITRLYTNKHLLREMGINARKKIIGHFDWDIQTKKTKSVFDNVLEINNMEISSK